MDGKDQDLLPLGIAWQCVSRFRAKSHVPMTGNTGSCPWGNLFDASLESSPPKLIFSLFSFFRWGGDGSRPPSMLTMLMYPGLIPRGSTVKRMKCFFPRTTMGFGSPPNSTLIGCPLINTVDKASTKRSTWGLFSMSNLQQKCNKWSAYSTTLLIQNAWHWGIRLQIIRFYTFLSMKMEQTACSETSACPMWGISSSFDLEEETCLVSAATYSVRDRRQWPMQRIGARVTAHCDYNSLKLCFLYPNLWNFYPNLFINMPQTQGHWQI